MRVSRSNRARSRASRVSASSHGEFPLQGGAAVCGVVAHPVVVDLVQPGMVSGDTALDLIRFGLRLEGIAIAYHPAGLQTLVAGDNPPVGGQSRPIELDAPLDRLLELPLGLVCDRGFLGVEPAHPRVFLTQERQVGRGGSDLVAQLFLFDLGQHVASLDRRTDRHRDLPQPPSRGSRDLEHGFGTLVMLRQQDPPPLELERYLPPERERPEGTERQERRREEEPVVQRDNPFRHVELFERLDGPLLDQGSQALR